MVAELIECITTKMIINTILERFPAFGVSVMLALNIISGLSNIQSEIVSCGFKSLQRLFNAGALTQDGGKLVILTDNGDLRINKLYT